MWGTEQHSNLFIAIHCDVSKAASQAQALHSIVQWTFCSRLIRPPSPLTPIHHSCCGVMMDGCFLQRYRLPSSLKGELYETDSGK